MIKRIQEPSVHRCRARGLSGKTFRVAADFAPPRQNQLLDEVGLVIAYYGDDTVAALFIKAPQKVLPATRRMLNNFTIPPLFLKRGLGGVES